MLLGDTKYFECCRAKVCKSEDAGWMRESVCVAWHQQYVKLCNSKIVN